MLCVYALGMIGCDASETGTCSSVYSSDDVNKDFLRRKSFTWIMDSIECLILTNGYM